MRDCDHFKSHLAVITETNVAGDACTEHYRQEVCDPFHRTFIAIKPTLWQRLRLLFVPIIEVTVVVQGDGCAMGRWFQGADICERCCRTRIDGPGQHTTKPGYESRGQRICHDCYYDLRPARVANETDNQSNAPQGTT